MTFAFLWTNNEYWWLCLGYWVTESLGTGVRRVDSDGRRIDAARSHCRHHAAAVVASADCDVDAGRGGVDEWQRDGGRRARLSLSGAWHHLCLHLLHTHQPSRWSQCWRRSCVSQESVTSVWRRRLTRCLHSRLPLQEILTSPPCPPDDEPPDPSAFDTNSLYLLYIIVYSLMVNKAVYYALNFFYFLVPWSDLNGFEQGHKNGKTSCKLPVVTVLLIYSHLLIIFVYE